MKRSALGVIVFASWVLAAGCGDSEECSGEGCGASADSGAGGGGAGSILGATPARYDEAQESTNGSSSGAEATTYTLETANGLAIHGRFEASGATSDVYKFNSGALGTLKTPGFPGVDIQLVIDGRAQRVNTPLSLSLDSVVERGYSSLSGGTYFSNAALLRGEEYVLTLAPFAPGKSYILEIRGHTP